jgi:potassium-transporting ATPase KdpC subunit
MLQEIRPAIMITLIFTVITGFIYPVAITGLSQALFRDHASGSLLAANGKVIGSSLIGQNFAKPEYFHPRPSAASDNGYDGMSSQGSSLAPTNPAPPAPWSRFARCYNLILRAANWGSSASLE